jgi:hypothetical protein
MNDQVCYNATQQRRCRIKTKKCSRCKVKKPINEFWARSRSKDRLCSQCKRCMETSRQERSLRSPGWKRDNSLRRKYGISERKYRTILKYQGNACKFCSHKPKASEVLHVDHNHSIKIVRWLLCSNCNTMIGLAGENPAILRTAADHLEQWQRSHRRRTNVA